MIRETSIEAYRDIKASGLLNKLNFEVYEAIVHSGPCSIRMLYDDHFKHKYNDRSISSRFSELERCGVIEALAKKPCAITNRKVLYWQATNRLPTSGKKAVDPNFPRSLKGCHAKIRELLAIIDHKNSGRRDQRRTPAPEQQALPGLS